MATQSPNKLRFLDTVLVRFTRNGKGGTVKMQTPLTIVLAQQLGWIPEGASLEETGILRPWQTACDCEGDYHPKSFQLIPKDSTLKSQAMTLDVTRVHRLVVVRREIENKKGKGKTLQLTFAADFSDIAGCKKLEQYMQTVDKSTLQLSYEQQMPLTEDSTVEPDEDQAQIDA